MIRTSALVMVRGIAYRRHSLLGLLINAIGTGLLYVMSAEVALLKNGVLLRTCLELLVVFLRPPSFRVLDRQTPLFVHRDRRGPCLLLFREGLVYTVCRCLKHLRTDTG